MFYHWNLNGVGVYDFAKSSLIHIHVLSYNNDIIFFSKTFPDSSFKTNNPKLNIPEYILLCSDHPSSSKRLGASVHYIDYLPVIRRDDISALVKCTVTVLNLGKTSIFFAYMYRSSSQSTD